MLNINFLPDSDREDLSVQINKGVEEYAKIWERDGGQIIKAFENISGLKFQEKEINAIVYVSILNARSFPLSLKADLKTDIKKGLLIHELCHRLLSGNHIRIKNINYRDFSLEVHKLLDLILYDILAEVYGKELADKMVRWES